MILHGSNIRGRWAHRKRNAAPAPLSRIASAKIAWRWAIISWRVVLVSSTRRRTRNSDSNYSRPGAAMQQIADWLEKLGMSEYAQRFAENRIDFTTSSGLDRSGPQRPRRCPW